MLIQSGLDRCKRCHARKVKCSGGYPCQACSAAGKVHECAFPTRKRKSSFNARYFTSFYFLFCVCGLSSFDVSYVNGIIQQNEHLKAQLDRRGTDETRQTPLPPPTNPNSHEGASATMTDVRPWFVNSEVTDTPILMAAVADAAYATRLRQVITTPQDTAFAHIPRVHYATDQQIMPRGGPEAAWPSPAKRRLLAGVALRYLSDRYHVVRRSAVLGSVEDSIRDPKWGNNFQRCKLWAILAIGEMYSSRSASGTDFPGLSYYANACSVLGHSYERPNVESVETRLILCLYSLGLNRRYSAYRLSGATMRIAIVIGLHLHIPPSQLGDTKTGEHRKRVFWTAYTIDRMCASMLGHPPAIQDDDIDINMPCSWHGDQTYAADFAHTDFHNAQVRLAAVYTRLVKRIYGKRRAGDVFVERVQQTLLELQAWSQELPAHLQLDGQIQWTPSSKPISLFLTFYQVIATIDISSGPLLTVKCYILALRPVLLHVFRKSVASWPHPPPTSDVPASAMTLSNSCVKHARKSLNLLMVAWVEGTYATFDFVYTQYMFSSMLVMAISSVLNLTNDEGDDGGDGDGDGDGDSDSDIFETASQYLTQLSDAGNYAAQEFAQHIKAIREAVALLRKHRESPRNGQLLDMPNSTTPMRPMGAEQFLSSLTTSTTLDSLLSQPYQDWQLLEAPIVADTSENLYWPDFMADNGFSGQ